MRRLALHWQILIGMGLGILWGLLASKLGWVDLTTDYVKPFGTIFVNLLKLIAVPLVLVSLIHGVSSLSDITQLSRIGTKAIGFYLITTVIAVSIGLIMVNSFQPGKFFSQEKREQFRQQYAETTVARSESALKVKEEGPLQFLVDIVPSNVFDSFSDNGKMLQVIFFSLLFGIALVLIPAEKAAPVKALFDGLNVVILKIVDIIMLTAPYGAFALLASIIVEQENAAELLGALGYYSFVVILGLAVLVFIVYSLAITLLTKSSYLGFLRGIFPAQLVAFTTSSSAATLPVTMEMVEKRLGVSKEVSSFVLPLGATINMDGTSLYQAVAAVFIAQAFGLNLDLTAQLGIILTATLASIGSAAVPGAGIVMLVIVLQQAKIPLEGIALILAVDRLLDMCRTTVNVTGDAMIAMLVAKSEGELNLEKT